MFLRLSGYMTGLDVAVPMEFVVSTPHPVTVAVRRRSSNQARTFDRPGVHCEAILELEPPQGFMDHVQNRIDRWPLDGFTVELQREVERQRLALADTMIPILNVVRWQALVLGQADPLEQVDDLQYSFDGIAWGTLAPPTLQRLPPTTPSLNQADFEAIAELERRS